MPFREGWPSPSFLNTQPRRLNLLAFRESNVTDPTYDEIAPLLGRF